MSSKQELIRAKCIDILSKVNDGLNEIMEIMNDPGRPVTSSSYGLSLLVQDSAVPITVQDDWINQWALLYRNDKAWVVSEARKACAWCVDNPSRRKTGKGARRYIGSWLARAWERDMAGRPTAAGSLDDYDRKNPVPATND